MKQARSRYWGAFLLLLALLVALAVWNINAGSVSLSGAEILRILCGPSDGSTEYGIVRTPSRAPLCWASPPGPSWRCPWS